ncbi:MAG: PD-(D/E)XK nuclease family protein, partial [Candidatus Cloacimonetes bacterium]|nr:PD-(D/E)XK nuclease family protein [Candidatus Cloacimonadota bacterium]
MRTFINVSFSEDLTKAALDQVRDGCVLVFPTRISAARARERFMEGWALQDCEFVAMEDFKDDLLLPSQPRISDDKRLLCLYQALSEEDREYFHINGYFDIVEWGNHFFQFFEECCDEELGAEVLRDLPGRAQITLLNWQEDYLHRVMDIRGRYRSVLEALGQSDPIFSRTAAVIQVPFSQKRVIFVNQYYYSKLEKALLQALEDAGNEVLVLVQAPAEDSRELQPPPLDLAGLEAPEYRLRSLEVIECENAEQMVLAFLANHALPGSETGGAVIVDSRFSQAHYRDLFDPARFSRASSESMVGSSLYQLLRLFQQHLEAMQATLDEAFMPLRLILDACAQEDFLRYYGLEAENKAVLLEELRFLLKKDILYVDRDLRLLGRLHHEQGFPHLSGVLSRHFALLGRLGAIARPDDLIKLIDDPAGLRIRELCREEELLHSDILDIFYERLSNFASLENLGVVADWKGLFGGEGLALAAAVLRLFLEALGSGKYSFHQALGSEARVEVSNLLDLRNLRHQTVYFFHAIEGEIPSNPSPVWLLNENQRARLGLKSYPGLRERERYYFLRTVLTSEHCVIFTYRDQDQDIEPGSFVTEIIQAMTDGALAAVARNQGEVKKSLLAPRLSKLYLAAFENLKAGRTNLPGLGDNRVCGLEPAREDFFTLPCSPAEDFGPAARIDASYYSLSWFRKNPFAWYLEHLRQLPELELRPKETLTRKLFGSIMHAYLSAVLLPLATKNADLAELERAFTDTGKLRDILSGLLNDPDRLYLYKIPQNYNHEFLVSIISENLVESIRAFYSEFLQPRLTDTAFRLIPEEEFMTAEERKGRELILLRQGGRDYSLRIHGKADLRIECPELNYIV